MDAITVFSVSTYLYCISLKNVVSQPETQIPVWRGWVAGNSDSEWTVTHSCFYRECTWVQNQKYLKVQVGGFRGLSVHVSVSVAEMSHHCLFSWLALQHVQHLHFKLISPHTVDSVYSSYLCLTELSYEPQHLDYFSHILSKRGGAGQTVTLPLV